MEANVDVRKLQLLNDRIAQTIEALNQVRLSVHGLSHTPFLPSNVPFTPNNIPFTPTNVPFPGYGMMPPTIPGYEKFFPGLQHTPFITPYTTPYVPGFTGFIPPSFMGGLSHSSPEFDKFFELRTMDPYRLAQTFPFINTPIWPTW